MPVSNFGILYRQLFVLFGFCLGRAAVCDYGIPWTFLLPFLLLQSYRDDIWMWQLNAHFKSAASL